MPKAQQLVKFLDESINGFVSSLPSAEKELFAKIQLLIKQLDLTGGNINVSVKNVSLINQIKREVDSVISSDKYIGNVKEYLDSFDGINQLQAEYFSTVTTEFSPPKVLETIKAQTVGEVITSLTEKGVGKTVTDELTTILKTNIQSGGSYADFTEQLRTVILGDDESGILERHAGTYVTDTISQYSATYSQTVASDLELEWYQYVGSLITTSRPFCIACVEKRYIHQSEIKSILNGNIDGKKVSLAGVNPDTTPENFPILRGGYNCRHQMLPVSEDAVTKQIRIELYTSKGIEFDDNGFAV